GPLVFGAFAAVATFVTFYLMTVFTLSWGTTHLGFTRTQFLLLQLVAVVFLAVTIPLSALLADRIGRKWSLVISSLMVMGFGLTFSWLFQGGSLQVLAFLSLGLAVMGMTYGPLGTALAEAYPTLVRYTGASLSFNLAGILGASLTPAIASALAQTHGIAYVGYYLSFAGLVTLVATWILYRKKNDLSDLN
ncbi:MAG: MFS transporter, partial [Spirochaetia bacterium]|nr:MFS transporter [Spirochaetia bacterium]